MDKIDGKSFDITAENAEKLKRLFPEVFIEGKIDFDKLQTILGEELDEGKEKYSFTWKGKMDAIRLAQKQSTGTLRPCKEESKNWDTTENLYIEGDNLEVLKLLQASYHNSIKMIYIDPPYNTGHDFVYEDNFADGIENYKNITEQVAKSNPETAGRYHTNWLNMMYPRLKLARVLLKDDGVIFISIDDNEVANLKKICDEIFGEDNFITIFTRKGSGGRQDSRHFAIVHEYILCYAKSHESFVSGKLQKDDVSYPFYDKYKKLNYKTQLLRKWGENSKRSDRPNLYYAIKDPDGNDNFPMLPDGQESCWRWGKTTMQAEIENGRVEFIKKDGKWIAYEKIFEPVNPEDSTKLYTTIIDDVGNASGAPLLKSMFNEKLFDYPKPVDLIKRIISFCNIGKEDIVLDFFSGSATTAHAVMNLNAENGGNRKYIMVQLPELTDASSEAFKAGYKNICEIGKERIRRAGAKIEEQNEIFKNTHVIETEEQLSILKKLKNSTNDVLNFIKMQPTSDERRNIDTGFKVFKLDSTNLVIWDNTYTEDEEELAERIKQQSLFYIKDGRNDLDLVAEIMLKNGRPLTDKITEQIVKNIKVYIIENPEYKILICLQPSITLEAVEAMITDLPLIGTFIFADRCFKDANDIINTREILKKEDRQMRLF